MDSDDEETVQWKGVPGVIVLINVYDPSKKNTAALAHAATCRMVRHHLRLSSSQLVGVCLYGTEDSNVSAFGSKSIIDVIPLSAPTLDDFKKLRDVDVSSYVAPKEFKMSDALWQCSKMFTNCKKLLMSRTVIVLSRLDKAPVESDQKPTLKRVRDLVDLNIDLRVVNIANEEYNVDEFYINLLKEANKGRDVEIPHPLWNVKEIVEMIQKQSHRHLAVAQLKFEIGEGLFIGVGVYNLLNKTYHKKLNLDRETNAVVNTVTKTVKVINTEEVTMDVDEGETGSKEVPLLRSEILYYQEIGGERIEFTDTEMKKLRNPFGPPMMKLLGFKPATIMCKEKWFLKSGCFLFPNENIVEGSIIAFKAMYQACVDTKMVAICVLSTRVNAKTSIVALAPCTHPLGLDVDIGFDVVHIPFVENLRDLPAVDEEEGNITEEQKDFVKNMLKSLKFDYKPDMFVNPKLQCEYRAVEAIALEEDLDPLIDTTKPSAKNFEGLRPDKFEELFGPFAVIAPKRSAQRAFGTTTGAKRAKPEELDESVLKYRVQTSTVEKYTVSQLKDILREIINNPEVPALTSLKKAQLVELVYKYYK